MAQFLVDTNVLLSRLDRARTNHAMARQALQTLRNRGDELVLVPQVFYEAYVVLTRPQTARGGFGLSPAKATRLLDFLIQNSLFLPDTTQIFLEWRRLVETYRVSGVAAHDARLIAAMKSHGLTQILTFNGADFARYSAENIVVIDASSL